MAFRSLKYLYVGKNLRICGLGPHENLWICDLRINHYKFMDLRAGTPKKFADLRLRNDPINVQICDLRTNTKISVPTYAEQY
jgi:hypothetical protein